VTSALNSYNYTVGGTPIGPTESNVELLDFTEEQTEMVAGCARVPCGLVSSRARVAGVSAPIIFAKQVEKSLDGNFRGHPRIFSRVEGSSRRRIVG